MHSGIPPGVASLESCCGFLSVGGMLSLTVSKRWRQWPSGDFVLWRHIVAHRHCIYLSNSSLERLNRWQDVSGRSVMHHQCPWWCLCTSSKLDIWTVLFFTLIKPCNECMTDCGVHPELNDELSARRQILTWLLLVCIQD